MNDRTRAVTLVLALLTLAAITTVAWRSGRFVLTAVPVGVLFGFFLQKGDLCGSSAFSEVVLTRDARKLWGLWVAIVVSMLGVALGDLLGLVQLNPKPLIWASALVGGAVFGIGMVLAGGCVSGCLYKGATGNLNSLVALLAMPLGIGLVEYGPLNGWSGRLRQIKVAADGGGPITLSSLSGLPFWALALLFALATLGVAIARRRAAPETTQRRPPSLSAALRGPWRPWQAGVAIGLLALPAYVSSAASGRNYPLGVTHGVLQASLLLTDAPVRHVVGPPATPASGQTPATNQDSPRKRVVWWLVLLVGGLMAGAHLAGRLSGEARLLPKPPEQVLVAMFGGFLVGMGAALGTGCVIGNILSGWALMSVGMFLFGAVVLLANWATTVLYLRGLS